MLYQLSYASTLERETGIEPATNSLEGCDSTIELLPRNGRSEHDCSKRSVVAPFDKPPLGIEFPVRPKHPAAFERDVPFIAIPGVIAPPVA